MRLRALERGNLFLQPTQVGFVFSEAANLFDRYSFSVFSPGVNVWLTLACYTLSRSPESAGSEIAWLDSPRRSCRVLSPPGSFE